jgi:RimJ/RimL family protein N-acetyltransferase
MPTTTSTPSADLDPATVLPRQWSRRTSLRDGTTTLLRQIRPEDRTRLSDGFDRLSPASRLQRFHGHVHELSDRQLDYLTDVDHVDHEAVVAIDVDHPQRPGIGVARYVRDPFERDVAEATVVVADAHHGQGAGTLLLGALAARARAQGITRFRSYVLRHNTPMLALFDQLGGTREPESEDAWRVELSLPSRTRDLPDTPAARAFLAATRRSGPRGLLRLTRRLRATPIGAANGLEPGIQAELTPLADGIEDWLAHRDDRAVRWPADRSG